MIDTNDNEYRIVGIDPGTITLGVALLGFDLQSEKLHLIEATTYSSEEMIHRYPNLRDTHGDRFAKIYAHRMNLLNYFRYKQPHAISSEAPFFGRLPQPYAALTECVYSIRLATLDYDICCPLHVYDPATVKKNVGVSGKSGDKTAMRNAVKKLAVAEDEVIDTLDEHAVDAIAVAYTHYLTLI